MMKELAGELATCSAATRRSSRSSTRRYLADPASVPSEWRDYFDELQLLPGGAPRTSRTRRSSSRSSSCAQSRQGRAARWSTRRTMRKQVLGAAADQQVPHRSAARWPTSIRCKRHARGRTSPSSSLRYLRPHRGRPRHRVRRRLVQGGPGADALRDIIAALQETYCAHDRRRVHVHLRHGDASAGSRSGSSRSARSPTFTPEQQKHILERLTAAETLERYLHTQVRRPEALLAAKAATR